MECPHNSQKQTCVCVCVLVSECLSNPLVMSWKFLMQFKEMKQALESFSTQTS